MTHPPGAAGADGGGVFDRIVVGVDGSPAGEAAAAQAASLLAPGGTLCLVAASDRASTVAAGWSSARLAEEIEREADEALERAAALAPGATTHRSNAGPLRALLHAVRERDATLVAVGTRSERRRALGIALGSVATTLLHDAPCSVLVARGECGPGFPRAVVAGADGSPESLLALDAARELVRRSGGALAVVTASGGKDVDVEAALQARPDTAVVDERPVPALLAAAADADLLVVGSRGLHGLRALGSVSERVAHEARCSVLVARRPRSGAEDPVASTV